MCWRLLHSACNQSVLSRSNCISAVSAMPASIGIFWDNSVLLCYLYLDWVLTWAYMCHVSIQSCTQALLQFLHLQQCHQIRLVLKHAQYSLWIREGDLWGVELWGVEDKMLAGLCRSGTLYNTVVLWYTVSQGILTLYKSVHVWWPGSKHEAAEGSLGCWLTEQAQLRCQVMILGHCLHCPLALEHLDQVVKGAMCWQSIGHEADEHTLHSYSGTCTP